MALRLARDEAAKRDDGEALRAGVLQKGLEELLGEALAAQRVGT
jgi:hypothetical protein